LTKRLIKTLAVWSVLLGLTAGTALAQNVEMSASSVSASSKAHTKGRAKSKKGKKKKSSKKGKKEKGGKISAKAEIKIQ